MQKIKQHYWQRYAGTNVAGPSNTNQSVNSVTKSNETLKQNNLLIFSGKETIIWYPKNYKLYITYGI